MTLILDTQTFEKRLPAAAFVLAATQPAIADPILIGDERPEDAATRELLLDRAFGSARFRKTCHRLRAGRLPARGLSLVARVSRLGGGEVVGTVRLWHVDAGGVPALMLGPLAVDARYRCSGIGARLMEAALERALALGHAAVLLVGDAPYYAKFGFERRHTLSLRMPGPIEDERFLGFELQAGAFSAAKGSVTPTGAIALSRQTRALRPRLRRAA